MEEEEVVVGIESNHTSNLYEFSAVEARQDQFNPFSTSNHRVQNQQMISGRANNLRIRPKECKSDGDILEIGEQRSFSHIRFSKDYQELIKQSLSDEKCSVDLEKPLYLNEYIKLQLYLSPQTGIYAGMAIAIIILVTNEYPYKPLLIFAEQDIYHPNINYSTRQFFLDILDDREWKPTLTLYFIILKLKFTFQEPDLSFVPNNPQNIACAELYQCDQRAFSDRVRHINRNNNNNNNMGEIEFDINQKLQMNQEVFGHKFQNQGWNYSGTSQQEGSSGDFLNNYSYSYTQVQPPKKSLEEHLDIILNSQFGQMSLNQNGFSRDFLDNSSSTIEANKRLSDANIMENEDSTSTNSYTKRNNHPSQGKLHHTRFETTSCQVNSRKRKAQSPLFVGGIHFQQQLKLF